MDAAHFAQTFWTCHVDTVIDVSGVSALSQITSFALVGERHLRVRKHFVCRTQTTYETKQL